MGFVQLFIIYLTINIKNIHDLFIKWEDKVKTNDSLKQKKTFSTSKQTRNDNCFNSPLGLKHFAPINFILQFQQSVLVKLWYYRKYNLSTPRTLQWKKNTNYSFITYYRTMNSIIVGQLSFSRKSNTGGISTGADSSAHTCTSYMYVDWDLPSVSVYSTYWRIIFLQNSWSLLIFNFHSD